jgi:hypothetical protein
MPGAAPMREKKEAWCRKALRNLDPAIYWLAISRISLGRGTVALYSTAKSWLIGRELNKWMWPVPST